MKNFLQDSTQAASIVESSIDPSTTIKNYGVVGTHSSLLAHGRTRIFQAAEESHFVLAHNHASDLFCVVLKGEVYHNLFEEHPQGKPYLICEQTGSLGDYQYQGTVTKNFIRNYNAYEAGESYNLEAAEFHTISFAEGTSVLIVEGEPKGLKREVLFPMIDGAGYNPAEGGQFIQAPKRIENFSGMVRAEGILSEIPEVVFVVEIDTIPLTTHFKEIGTEQLKEAFVSIPTSEQVRILTALKDRKYRRPNLRKLLRSKQSLGENAIYIIRAILNIEAVDLSQEFAKLVRETIPCNGFLYEKFCNHFDGLDVDGREIIINALMDDCKERLNSILSNHPRSSEELNKFVLSLLEHVK